MYQKCARALHSISRRGLQWRPFVNKWPQLPRAQERDEYHSSLFEGWRVVFDDDWLSAKLRVHQRERNLRYALYKNWYQMCELHTELCTLGSTSRWPLGAVNCAVGWTESGRRCFLPVVTERVAWSTADDRCRRRGAQLVQIKRCAPLISPPLPSIQAILLVVQQ